MANQTYEDKRLTDVKTEEATQLSQLEQTFADRENAYNQYENKQNANIDSWEKTQTKLQNEQTNFAIDEIERNKAQAKKDYTKEQSGAYVDWQKQSNPYGANAEQMAAGGFTGSGYSESSQVAMYNAYQNRIAVARETYQNIIADYNVEIDRARLNNDVQLAELANKAQEQRLNLMLQGVTYRDNLLSEKVEQKLQVQSFYQTKWKDMLEQINAEKAYEEEVRQFNETIALQKEQAKQTKAYQDAQIALEREKLAMEKAKQSSASIKKSSGSSGSSSSKKSSSETTKEKIAKSPVLSRVATNISATTYLEQLIKSGASKDKVSNEIALALREGAITKSQAQTLRNKFTPRGVQY